jgi:hypothetical protein
MPQSSQHGESGEPRRQTPDDLIDQNLPDPASTDVATFKGRHLGNSNREGYYRLYLDSALSHYFEFRKDDTVDATRLPSGQVLVWLRPGARVQETVSRTLAAEFLQGEIASSLTSRADRIDTTLGVLRLAGPGCGTDKCLPPPEQPKTEPPYRCSTSIGFSCGCPPIA